MPIEVYYAIEKGESIPGYAGTAIITTERSYWDQNHFVSDGGSPNHDRILHAMENSGTEEVQESQFEMLTGVTIEQVIQNMAAQGFKMVNDPAFAAFVHTHC